MITKVNSCVMFSWLEVELNPKFAEKQIQGERFVEGQNLAKLEQNLAELGRNLDLSQVPIGQKKTCLR